MLVFHQHGRLAHGDAGWVSETQWDCLVRFMVIDFNESPEELREILGPLVGDKYEGKPLNTLERFFEKEEVII